MPSAAVYRPPATASVDLARRSGQGVDLENFSFLHNLHFSSATSSWRKMTLTLKCHTEKCQLKLKLVRAMVKGDGPQKPSRDLEPRCEQLLDSIDPLRPKDASTGKYSDLGSALRRGISDNILQSNTCVAANQKNARQTARL